MLCAGAWRDGKPNLRRTLSESIWAMSPDVKLEAMPILSLAAKNRHIMKSAALIFAASCVAFSTVALAKDRPVKDHPWKDAKVIDITTEKGGAVVVPVAALLASSPMIRTFYWIQTEDTIYVLGPVITRSRLLNVTLHGPTKVAVDGNSAHILDDDGRDKKIAIAEKIGRPKSKDPQ
jgi:hypothetical protein